MKKLLLFAGFLVIWAFLVLPAGCTYYNEVDLYGAPAPCDTIGMRYSGEIKAILEANCYSCHSVANNVSGYPFEEFDIIHDYAVAGTLVARINDPILPMPQTGLMNICDRQKIEAWVNAGAPNN
ncbi:MAG: hypothetical protein ABIQ93_09380 [Saprospiraceae bacterium]